MLNATRKSRSHFVVIHQVLISIFRHAFVPFTVDIVPNHINHIISNSEPRNGNSIFYLLVLKLEQNRQLDKRFKVQH